MKVVISDTSPINYLMRIGEIEVLPRMFGTVLVPPAVLNELRHPKAPVEVRRWAQQPPAWIRECSPDRMLSDLDLDPGESEAISLASENSEALLIIDEMKGRRTAQRLGILVAGTLNLLDEADRLGFLEFGYAIEKLRATNFRMNEELIDQLFRKIRERKREG